MRNCAHTAAEAVCGSEVGMASCINTGLVLSIVKVMDMHCGVEARTAATVAFATWIGADIGRAALRANAAACDLVLARKALMDMAGATDYTSQQMKRVATIALARM
jgi:hypothetical protein